MRKIVLSISMLGGVMLSYAQVGVGTTTPQASLHVKETRDASNLNNTASKDGIIPPTLTKSELSKKAASTYASAQNGAIVFVNEITTATAPSDPSLTQVADINAIGYYYFDNNSSKWVKLTPSVPTQDLRYVGTNNHVTQDAGVGGNGSSAGTGSDNIAIGKGTLNAITSSAESVAVGSGALNKLTTGIYNNAIGKNALNNITTQSSNTAFGYEALQALTTSFNGMNSALGYRTGMQLKTGSKNTFLGNNTATFLNATATHDSNTFVGTEVTTANNADPGVNVIYLETTALGALALNNIPAAVTNINYSTFLGRATTLTSSTSGIITNATAIGSSAQVGASNSIVLGRANATGTLDNVGIGVTSPLNALHVKAASNPVKLEGLVAADATANNLVVVGTDGVLKTIAKTTFATAGSGDTTNDAWVNNATNTRVELGTKSDGTTARTTGTEMVVTDAGRVGIGTTSPSSTLEVKKSVTSSTDTTNPKANPDGIIPPNITKAELANKTFSPKTYDAAQTGTLVYVTDITPATGTPPSSTQVANISTPGLYMFDGSTWRSTAEGGVKKIQGAILAPVTGTGGNAAIPNNSQTGINLKSNITLPYGKWEVEVYMLLNVGNTAENSYTWAKLSFADSDTAIVSSSDITSTSKLISGGVTTTSSTGDGNPFFGLITGKVIITNTSITPKSYYLIYAGSNYKGPVRNINNLGSSNFAENFISAMRVD